MEKDFNKWNEKKKELELFDKQVLFNEGEIWWLNIKQESCGKGDIFRRPVLVFKKLSKSTFIGIPLSSKIKTGTWFVNYTQNKEKFTALLYQIRMFDIVRLQRKLGELDSDDFLEIKKGLKNLLNL